MVRASVSFAGEGYAGAMGWIQVLRYGGGDLGDERAEVDLPPQHQDANTPYCFWGIRPAFFDAPSMPHRDVTWKAEAFLATSPDALITRTVRPICGFRWGYATTREPPRILPPESLDLAAWELVRPTLRERYPAWDFLPARPTPPRRTPRSARSALREDRCRTPRRVILPSLAYPSALFRAARPLPTLARIRRAYRNAYREASGRRPSTSASSDGYTISFETTSSPISAMASTLASSSIARNRSGSESAPP